MWYVFNKLYFGKENFHIMAYLHSCCVLLVYEIFYFIKKVLSANQNGEMKLMVETDMVSISTHFRDLVNPVSK